MTGEPAAETARASTRQLSTVAVFAFVLTAIVFARLPLLPGIARDLHLSMTWLGLLTAVFGLTRLAVDLPVGRITDRGPALLILAAMGCTAAAGAALLAGAYNLVTLLVAFAVIGLASAVTNAATMTYFSARVPFARRGAALAGLSTALLGGQVLGPAGAGMVAQFLSWRVAALIAVGAGLLVSVGALVAAGGGETPARRAKPPPIPIAHTIGGKRERWAVYSVAFATFFALSSLTQTMMPIIAADRFHMTAGAIGLALAAAWVGRMLIAQVGGYVADRFSRKAALVPALLLMAIGSGLVGLFVFAAGSISTAAANALLADGAPAGQLGRRLGEYRFVGDVGLITGPVLVALLYERFGSAVALAPVTMLLAACALAVAFLAREVSPPPTSA